MCYFPPVAARAEAASLVKPIPDEVTALMKHLPILLAWLALTGCGGREEAPGPVTMNDQQLEEWQIALVEMRIDKNEAFMDSTRSPLRPADIPGFEGLNYYQPEPALRFRTPLIQESRPDTVLMTKRRGQQVPYVRVGKVAFKAGGKTQTLSVFGPATPEEEAFLWLPFYDETSGKETYGGGRYLDLKLAPDGTVDLDFNFAYNPLCDYNPERYNCTLPPPENRLPLAVRAGETLFRPEGH